MVMRLLALATSTDAVPGIVEVLHSWSQLGLYLTVVVQRGVSEIVRVWGLYLVAWHELVFGVNLIKLGVTVENVQKLLGLRHKLRSVFKAEQERISPRNVLR